MTTKSDLSPKPLSSKRRNSASDGRSDRVHGTPRMRIRNQSAEEGNEINVPNDPPVVSARPWTNTTLVLEASGDSIFEIGYLIPYLINQLDPLGESFYPVMLWGTSEYGNKWRNTSGVEVGSMMVKIQKPNLVIRIRNIKVWSVSKTPFQLQIYRIKTDPIETDAIIFDEKAPREDSELFALGYKMPLTCRKIPLYARSTTRDSQVLFKINCEPECDHVTQINLEWKPYKSVENSDSEPDCEKRRLSDYDILSEEDPLETSQLTAGAASLTASNSFDNYLNERLINKITINEPSDTQELRATQEDAGTPEEKVLDPYRSIKFQIGKQSSKNRIIKAPDTSFKSRLMPTPIVEPPKFEFSDLMTITPLNNLEIEQKKWNETFIKEGEQQLKYADDKPKYTGTIRKIGSKK